MEMKNGSDFDLVQMKDSFHLHWSQKRISSSGTGEESHSRLAPDMSMVYIFLHYDVISPLY